MKTFAELEKLGLVDLRVVDEPHYDIDFMFNSAYGEHGEFEGYESMEEKREDYARLLENIGVFRVVLKVKTPDGWQLLYENSHIAGRYYVKDHVRECEDLAVKYFKTNMLTLKQGFDIVKKHLLTQNKQSVEEFSGKCRYRGGEGLKCAIGCLIPDDMYKPEFEDRGFLFLHKNVPDLKPHIGSLGAIVPIEVQHKLSAFMKALPCQYVKDLTWGGLAYNMFMTM